MKDEEKLNYVGTRPIENSQCIVRRGGLHGHVRCITLGINFVTKDSTPSPVGWMDLHTPICLSCYLCIHYHPGCRNNVLAAPGKDIRNYEGLNAPDRLCVLDNSYCWVMLVLKSGAGEELKPEVNNAQKNR